MDRTHSAAKWGMAAWDEECASGRTVARCDVKCVEAQNCHVMCFLHLSVFLFSFPSNSLIFAVSPSITASILFLIHLSPLYFSASFFVFFLPTHGSLYTALSLSFILSPLPSLSLLTHTHKHTLTHFLMFLIFSSSPPSPVTSRPSLKQRSQLRELRRSWRRRTQLRKKQLSNSHRFVCSIKNLTHNDLTLKHLFHWSKNPLASGFCLQWEWRHQHFTPLQLADCSFLPLSAPGGAPEGSAPSGLPAAEFGSPGSAAAEVMEPGEDSSVPGVSAPQTGSATSQPQTTLLPQTVAAGLQEGHGMERHLGGMRGRTGQWHLALLLCCWQMVICPGGLSNNSHSSHWAQLSSVI